MTVTGTWQTHRVSHAQLETHGTAGWFDDDGRLVLRTSTQVPFLVRGEICRLFELPPDRVRVLTGRVGGGFGGKQELLTEDLVALAVLRTGRPVVYEMSRREEFVRTTVRHPMRVTVTLGATADGRLTAMQLDVLSDTGAYGNHALGVLFHGCAESVSIYRSPIKRLDAEVVYTNNTPSGAFRGYGLGQVILGVESAMDDLARGWTSTRSSCAGATWCRTATRCSPCTRIPRSTWCTAVRPRPVPRSGAGGPAPRERRRGAGRRALAARRGDGRRDDRHHCTAGPHLEDHHPAAARRSRRARRRYHASSATARPPCTPRSWPPCWPPGSTGSQVTNSDTDGAIYDTGAFASAGTTVAGKALFAAASTLRQILCETAASVTGVPSRGLRGGTGRGAGGRPAVGFAEIIAAAPAGHRDGDALIAHGDEFGEQRSLAFNVQAFRVAVDVRTGEVRILQSVQAADAGVVLNPEQCRGQVEGGTAQAIGTLAVRGGDDRRHRGRW